MTEVSMRRYLLRFAAGYLIAVGVLVLLAWVFPGLASSGAGAVTLLCGGLMAIQAFLNEQRRLLDRREKRRLLWGSFAIAMALQLLGMLMLSIAKPLPFAMMAVVVVVVALVTLGVLALFYSDWYSRILLRNIEKHAAKRGR